VNRYPKERQTRVVIEDDAEREDVPISGTVFWISTRT
jgi:hypothetical protein